VLRKSNLSTGDTESGDAHARKLVPCSVKKWLVLDATAQRLLDRTKTDRMTTWLMIAEKHLLIRVQRHGAKCRRGSLKSKWNTHWINALEDIQWFVSKSIQLAQESNKFFPALNALLFRSRRGAGWIGRGLCRCADDCVRGLRFWYQKSRRKQIASIIRSLARKASRCSKVLHFLCGLMPTRCRYRHASPANSLNEALTHVEHVVTWSEQVSKRPSEEQGSVAKWDQAIMFEA